MNRLTENVGISLQLPFLVPDAIILSKLNWFQAQICLNRSTAVAKGLYTLCRQRSSIYRLRYGMSNSK